MTDDSTVKLHVTDTGESYHMQAAGSEMDLILMLHSAAGHVAKMLIKEGVEIGAIEGYMTAITEFAIAEAKRTENTNDKL